jgi:tocopherol O-methyltransferase
MIALRLVIDSNILVSAALKPQGLQRTVLVIAMAKPARLYFSSKILAAYKEVLSRPEIRIRISLRSQLLQLLQNQAHFVKPSRRRKVTSDPLDNIFLECADAGRSDYLVTGNLGHFPRFCRQSKIVSSRVSRSCLSALIFTLTVSGQAGQLRCELRNEKRLRNLELFATGLALGTMTIARLTGSGECSRQMPRSNDKPKIIEHYDVLGPLYRSVWGEHLHHGYWITGDESKERAQLQLVERLAKFANIQPNSSILDIGCGFGASTLYLAKEFHATVTGITISPVQIEMAKRVAKEKHLDATFLLMDAEAMDFQQQFDLLWSVESISHYQDRRKFFASAARLLKPYGTFAITDWFKKDHLTPSETREFIDPIEKGMFVELQTMDDYQQYFTANGLDITHREVLNKNCAKTWDLSLEIIKDKKFWILAAKLGSDFVTYLKAFHAMRAGFASGNFVYGLLIASANSND